MLRPRPQSGFASKFLANHICRGYWGDVQGEMDASGLVGKLMSLGIAAKVLVRWETGNWLLRQLATRSPGFGRRWSSAASTSIATVTPTSIAIGLQLNTSLLCLDWLHTRHFA